MYQKRKHPPITLRTLVSSIVLAELLTVLLAACGEASPTAQPVAGTVTPVRATATPVPATSVAASTASKSPGVTASSTTVPASPVATNTVPKNSTIAPTLNPSVSLDPKKLPLGDGKIANSPQKGYIYACQRPGGGGAQRDGEWIQGASWDSTRKIQVQGEVKWSNASYQALIEGSLRKITGNSLPSHNTGIFPIARTDPAFQYDRNPNSIQPHPVSFNLSVLPVEAAKAGCLPMGTIGIARSGVAIFNGLDAEGRDAVAHEIQDKCNGHPEREGTYHYHSFSSCGGGVNSQLFGYALDGFGIFSLVENGKEITNQDLDECHGHKHEIEWDGKKVTLYHYHVTREYPYTLGCYKGTAINNRPGR